MMSIKSGKRRLLITIVLFFVIISCSIIYNDGKSVTIHKAICEGDLHSVNKWLRKGGDSNGFINGFTLLTYMGNTKCSPNTAVIKTLISHGADVNKVDKGGMSPINSSDECQLDALELYLKNGADINAMSPTGFNVLTVCVDIWTEEEALKYVKFLFDNGFDFNFKSRNGLTASGWLHAKKYKSVLIQMRKYQEIQSSYK